MAARAAPEPSVSARTREITQVVRLLRHTADRQVLGLGLASVGIVVTGGALAALAPLVLQSLVDAVASSRPAANSGPHLAAVRTGVAYLSMLLAGRVLADIRPLLSGAISQRLHSRLAQRFFDHVLRLPLGYLLQRRGGELLHGLDLGSAGAQLLVAHLTTSVLPVLVELVTMTTVLVRLGQPALVVVFGASALAYLVIFSTGAQRLIRTAHQVSTSSLEMYAQLGDGLAHLETLRSFAAEEQASQRLRRAAAALEQRWHRLNGLNATIALAASATFALSMAACVHIGAGAVAQGAMTIGGFVLVTVYMLQIVGPLESLGSAARDLSRALGYLRPLIDLLAQPVSDDAHGATHGAFPAAAPMAGEDRARAQAPAVQFENLHFGYDPDRPVIKGINLHVPAGTTTAIVGRSGSGKSSLARLLMRLYAPQQGRVLLDGRPIDSIEVETLRRQVIGLVPQETALLHATIAENIALGMPTATRDDICAAARGAQLQELLDALPLGLDTPVGERGMRLSGGERQRVGIARALLRRPRLYLLDEPTSALDSKTELDIQQVLRALPTDATTIVIAHRLSTIADADEIVVLEDGQIRERGNHRALLAHDGVYAQMWRQQQAGPA
jgi:ATP-binding cassette subfamily B protein